MKTHTAVSRLVIVSLIAWAASASYAMGKTPSNDGTETAPATPPPNAPPANPYYNSPSNTGTSAPQNQGSMPINKGTRGPTESNAPAVPPGSGAATGVGAYGGTSAPSGGR